MQQEEQALPARASAPGARAHLGSQKRSISHCRSPRNVPHFGLHQNSGLDLGKSGSCESRYTKQVFTYNSLTLEEGSPRLRLCSIHAGELKFIWDFQQTALPAPLVFHTRGTTGDTRSR